MNIPSVAGCINRITETVASVPIKLYEVKGDSVKEVKDDIRTRLLNEETGDTLDGVQFKRALIRDYFLGKGGYAHINKTGNDVKSLHYVEESNISFQIGNDVIFKDYDILVQGENYKPYEFIRILRNTTNGYSGKSILEENNMMLTVAYNTLKFENNLVSTGGNKKGFITSAKKLTEEAIKKLKAAWKNLYQNSTENVVILNEGLDFKESSNTSVELQLNENKKTNGEEICKIFKLTPSALAGKATDADEKANVKYCYMPIFDVFEKAVNRSLLLEKEKHTRFFAFDASELTKGDIEKRYEAHKLGVEAGFLQIDEVRFKENLPPLGLNFIKLGLQDVIYDPKRKTIYTPNTNKTVNIEENGTKIGEEE